MRHYFRIGDHVRLTSPYAGGSVGEEAEISFVTRDEQGEALSLDILFRAFSERARSATVYPREIELVYPRRVIASNPASPSRLSKV